jgi:geranylgeranyl pyrophosphate synthase
MMAEFEGVRERLAEAKAAVDAGLDAVLTGEPEGLFEVMRYAVLGGGKRFRPLLLVESGLAFGAPRSLLLPYACAIELIHSYSLVHDDLPAMDDDDERRGRPSCHVRFGEGPALLAGDGLLSLAFEVIAKAPLGPGGAEAKVRALRTIAEAAGVGGMIRGQWLDITAPRGEADEALYLDVAGKKTGALIRGAVEAGAVLAGAPVPGLESASEYGALVGLAFQVRDDIADAAGPGGDTGVNAVTLLGPEGARRRLADLLARAREALDRGKIDSAGLRFLAASLGAEDGR